MPGIKRLLLTDLLLFSALRVSSAQRCGNYVFTANLGTLLSLRFSLSYNYIHIFHSHGLYEAQSLVPSGLVRTGVKGSFHEVVDQQKTVCNSSLNLFMTSGCFYFAPKGKSYYDEANMSENCCFQRSSPALFTKTPAKTISRVFKVTQC